MTRRAWSKMLCTCLAVLCLAACGANGNSVASSNGGVIAAPSQTSSASAPGPEAETPAWVQPYVEYYVNLLLESRGEEKEIDDSEIFDWTLFTLGEPMVLIEPLWADGPPVVRTQLEFLPQFILFDTGIETFPGSPSSICTFYWDSTGKLLICDSGGAGDYYAIWYPVSAAGMGEMLFTERAEMDGTVSIGDLQNKLTESADEYGEVPMYGEGGTVAWLDEHRPEVLAQHGYTAPLTPCKKTEYDLPKTSTLPELEAYLTDIFTEYAKTLGQ